jgi:diguanylate cyclase (GGDEF)-like protein
MSKSTEARGLCEAMHALASGDFSATAPTDGTDEFAALGKELNSMARQLEARLEDLQRLRASVTASLGIASLANARAETKQARIASADAALYEAKRSGKNRTVRGRSPEGRP